MRWLLLCLIPSLAAADNLASFGAGALIVKEPAAYDGKWSGFWLLDEDPHSGYASPKGDVGAKEFVIELADVDRIDQLGFDIADVDGEGRGARAVTAELGDAVGGPWKPLVAATLVAGKDNQRFKATPQTGRYLRVVIKANQGSADYVELMGVAAYGTVVAKQTMPDASGAYRSEFGTFRVAQRGVQGVGCYEHKEGLIQNGGFDGRVLRFTWSETVDGKRSSGPAVLVFPADGKTFLGLWWNGADVTPAGRWDGVLESRTIGVCPHYAFAPQSAVHDALAQSGRARVYGILFDTDSDRLKPESTAVLDELVAVAKAEKSLTIEGHTDNTGTPAHNQTLSEQRAAAVVKYLVAHGVAAARLTTKGFGATVPVSTNDTALGRSQNRRVEITR